MSSVEATVAGVLAMAGLALVLAGVGFHQRIPLILFGADIDRLLDRAARKHRRRTIFELQRPLSWQVPVGVAAGSPPREWSAEKIRDTAALIAGVLRTEVDVQRNDRVAICKRNHFDFFLFSSAITRIGAISVPMNGNLATDAMTSYLRDVGATALFSDTRTINRFLSEGGSLCAVKVVIVVDCQRTLDDGTPHELSDTLAAARHTGQLAGAVFRALEPLLNRADRFEPAHARGTDDPLYIVHTSGTTGPPKGVILLKRGLMQSLRAAFLINLVNRRDLAYVVVPFNHQVTHLYLNAIVAFGSKAIIADEFDPRTALEALSERRVRVFFGFPVTYTQMAAQPLGRYDLRAMRVWCTTADSSHEVHQRAFIAQGSFLRRFGIPLAGSLFVDGLGSSEVGIAALLRIAGPWTRRFARRVGRPLPMFGPRVKVVDAQGRKAATAQPGRLMIKGACMFGGYWNAHDRFFAAADDGWWFTGDIVRREADGCYVHLDREVDVIHHRDGVSYTLPIEEEILKHPAVFDATVFAWQQPDSGVVPAAAVALHDGYASLSAETLRTELNALLPPNDRLHRVDVLPWQEFPIGVTGKTLKRAFTARAVAGLRITAAAALMLVGGTTASTMVCAQGLGDAWELRHSHTMTISYDTLRSEIDGIPSPNRQATFLFASNLTVTCIGLWCRHATLVARPWVGGLTGNVGTMGGVPFRDVYENPTLRLQEAYVTARPIAAVSIGAGKQVMGWGPGILYSPSNRLFAETLFSSEQRQVAGKRAAWATVDLPSSPVRLTVTAARADDGGTLPAVGPRSSAFIGRAEYLGGGKRAINAGLVGGAGNLYSPYLGDYFQAQLFDRLTVGTESSVSHDYSRTSPADAIALVPAGSPRMRADALVNARYAVGSGEVSAEFVWNGFAIDPRFDGAVRKMYRALLEGPTDTTPFHPLFEREYYVLLARIPRFLDPRVTVVSTFTYACPSGGSIWNMDASRTARAWKVFGSFSRAFGPAQSTLRYPFSRMYRVGFTRSL